MEWVADFYRKQNGWSGVYEEPISETNRQKAALIEEFAGLGSKRVLELGAGGGQGAAAAAELGHEVVAVELLADVCDHALQLASSLSLQKMTVVNADFYTVELQGRFDVVCYWDGFGIGTDADQQRLLRRIVDWLTPDGSALIEVGTSWYAASVDGRGWKVGDAERRYSFDADGCRWQDTWWPKGKPEEAVRQTTRCYSPADLRLLLAGSGLELRKVKPGGTMDWQAGKWIPSVPLKQAMSYFVQLCPKGSKP